MKEERLNIIKEKINKLKVIDYKEEEIYSESNFINIKKGNFTLNNGKTIKRETIYKKTNTNNTVGIIPITEDNKILLIITPRCSIQNKDKISIEIPAGYIEENELPITAAKRELLEETGYKGETFKEISSYYQAIGSLASKMFLFIGTNIKKIQDQNLDNDEYIEYIEVTIDEFKYLIDNNYIIDINTILSYHKLLEYIDKGW